MNEPPRCVLRALDDLRAATDLVVTAQQQRGDHRWALTVGHQTFGPGIDLYHLVEQATDWIRARGAA